MTNIDRRTFTSSAIAVLAAAGLQIYTSLDPRAQAGAERALAKHMKRLDASGKRKGTLEGGVVIARGSSGLPAPSVTGAIVTMISSSSPWS